MKKINSLKDLIKKINDPNKKYCEKCNIIIHRASYAKHLKSKKHLQDQKDILIQPTTSKEDIVNNPKSLKELARDKIKLNNRELNKEIGKKMFNPYYFKNKNLYNILKINLDSHHINHLNSKIKISSTTEYNSIDMDLINSLVKEMSVIYARLINQYKFKYQCVFLARFDKQNEDGMMLDEINLFINLKINHISTESDLININIRWNLEFRQIQ